MRRRSVYFRNQGEWPRFFGMMLLVTAHFRRDHSEGGGRRGCQMQLRVWTSEQEEEADAFLPALEFPNQTLVSDGNVGREEPLSDASGEEGSCVLDDDYLLEGIPARYPFAIRDSVIGQMRMMARLRRWRGMYGERSVPERSVSGFWCASA